MRRRLVFLAAIVLSTAVGAVVIQRASNWKRYDYVGSQLKVDLARPDAVIRTASLTKLPRDILKVPILRDVLTEDLAFYYEQHEDRLGLNGAIKRIAYERDLNWSDHLFASAMNEPAEMAFWRDGRGALRHYAVVIRRSVWNKVLQEAATVAIKDEQLKLAGEIDSGHGKLKVLALQVNPRRTFLLIGSGERLVLLSDPGLLFDGKQKPNARAQAAVLSWLEKDRVLSGAFALEEKSTATHTLALGSRALALGYGDFIAGFKGLRFDFNQEWSTGLWLAQSARMPAGNQALWQLAPANPAACMAVPVDWSGVQRVIGEAASGPKLPDVTVLAALNGSGLVCWYAESRLFSPLFIARLPQSAPKRDEALQALASWSIKAGKASSRGNAKLWKQGAAQLAARGDFVLFSPDAELVNKALDTSERTHPSVADQFAATDTLLALTTPRSLADMAGREVLDVVKKNPDRLALVQTQLKPKLTALARYPTQTLELAPTAGDGWQPLQWRAQGAVQ